ncbi:hypothetical protein SDRG_15499 [Saprolegnia diclina VS20]|uniref:Myb-like domain-containing protein n=1 Tax=Saprolegnia diclina (strain VS20) TaxID=1156394 RepID=T0PWP2_SAPDV|nr:hypothetical protein SDRG_15499 [Saprolegnia diclina VS20]EQC26661.1 hypothetical protein SDRG_15499 [Saprolegnia diclina VS20]|eukprot:XP_008619896.1 hypothetical protein SDRG_15499 [Saprolegnia diclina VS20]
MSSDAGTAETTDAGTTETNDSGTTETTRRRNWNDEEDVMLLRQISADRPFAQHHGRLRMAWAKVANTLMSCEEFTREVDAKKIQNRFSALLEAHKAFNKGSAAKSGVDEDETEKIMLLDDLTQQYAEAKAKAAELIEEKKAKNNESETAGQLVRDRAMTTCTKRKAEDPPARRNADTGVLEFLKRESDNAKEFQAESLKLQRLHFEADLAERRRERNDLREERQRQREDDERRRREEREEARAERKAVERREERRYQLHLAELETRKLELEMMLKRQG